MIHDYVQTPKEYLLLMGVVLGFVEGRANVVEDADEKPHPEVIFTSQELGLAVVDGMLEIVFAYPEHHFLI